MYKIYTAKDIIEIAKQFNVDQNDALETFICELLDISPDLLYEKLGQ